MPKDEQVLCLKRIDLEAIFGGSLPQGSFLGPQPEILLALSQHFLPRSHAEHDPDYKQIIPYQLFCCRDRFFVYQRGGKVGEQRLSGRLSVGIGGHINTDDTENGTLTPAAYHEALRRERIEELAGIEEVSARFIGWINDDSDPVGQVHLGAVHLDEVHNPDSLRIREQGEDLHAQGWWSAEEIMGKAEQFEKWSVLAVELCNQRKTGTAASKQKSNKN
jgi:predicted NUDIX family phosphoesterase